MSLSRSPSSGHHRGAGKQRLGRQRGGDPALRFLVRQVAQVVRDGAAALARPYLTAQKSEASAVIRINRQHRMQQHAVIVALADLPEPAPALWLGVEVDLAGVLDRQNMAAFAAATVLSLQLSMMRSVVTLALPRKRLNRTSSARSPFESRRRQTSLPATMRSTSAAPLYRGDDPRTDPMTNQYVTTCRHLRQSRSAAIGITPIPDSGIPYSRPESICRIRCVHALVRTQGPIRRGRADLRDSELLPTPTNERLWKV